MRRTALPVFLAALLIAAAAAAPARPAEDALSLWRENRRLQAEAALAATPKPYFELDLEQRRILLKTRGMVLLDVPVQEQGIWGRRLIVGPTAVVRRDALARPAVRTGDDKTPETLDEQLLELADMPTRYRLGLAGEINVEILPLATDRWPRFRQRLDVWRWRLKQPLDTLRQRRERRETTAVYLILKPEDAQRLYWTLFEGLDGILIPPR
ncbi:MAG: hypothetical protein ACYC9Y_05650 [Candidatus Methylomirabilia bacterium]